MSSVATADYYERLGVDRSATTETIKAAYTAAVRKHPPEKEPEQFKRLREAFDALKTPQLRAEYNATSDPQTRRFIEDGERALAEQRFSDAVSLFKRALIIHPDAHYIRNLLGVAYSYADEPERALDQFRRLTAEIPTSGNFWVARGVAARRLEKWGEAEDSFNHALTIDKHDSDAHIGLARTFAEQGLYARGEGHLEKAVMADGVVDFDDFSLFFELLTFKLRQGDLAGLRSVAERIEAILQEPWQRERVAYRFAGLAHELAQVRQFESALIIAEKSRKLAPEDGDLASLTAYIRGHAEIIREWARIQSDAGIRDPFKFVLAVILQNYFDEWDSEEEKARASRSASELMRTEVNTVVPAAKGCITMADELGYILKSYPALAATIPESMKQAIRSARALHRSVRLTCPHCGNEARADNETSRFVCPACNKPFDYVVGSKGAVSRAPQIDARRTAASAGSFLASGAIQVLVFLGVAGLIGMCN